MLTTEQLHAIMPKLPQAKGATFFPFLSAAVTEFGIESPARTAAFLAQLAHESVRAEVSKKGDEESLPIDPPGCQTRSGYSRTTTRG